MPKPDPLEDFLDDILDHPPLRPQSHANPQLLPDTERFLKANGITDQTCTALASQGFTSVDHMKVSDVDGLQGVPIGQKKALKRLLASKQQGIPLQSQPPLRPQHPSSSPQGRTCPKGHTLVHHKHNCLWNCDACRTQHNPHEGLGSWRCTSCDFDMCDRCAGTMPKPPDSTSIVHHYDPIPHPSLSAHVPSPSAGTSGNTRCLFIGINYTGTSAALRGCVNDVKLMMAFLAKMNFDTRNSHVLVDDPSFKSRHGTPIKKSIIAHMQWLVDGAKAGDTLFFHYSGHGSQLADQDGDEADGMDETIVPLDYQRHGQIRDDDVFDIMCRKLPAGVRLTAVADCCHSGSIMDLQYVWVPDKEVKDVTRKPPRPPRRSGANRSRGFEIESHKTCEADVVLFSGCDDSQTSADVRNTAAMFHNSLHLPGAAGGACTNALVEILSDDYAHGREINCSYVELLHKMQDNLKRRKFTQIPQLSSSKVIDVNRKFALSGGF